MAPVFHNKIFSVEYREFYDAPPPPHGHPINTTYIGLGTTSSSVRSWISQLPLLRDPSSPISQKITTVEIHGTDPTWLDHYPSPLPIMRKSDLVELILSTAAHLPNIHALTLIGFHWDIDFTPASRAMLQQLRGKIRQLTLGDVYFSRPQDAVELVTAFRRLERLVWQEPVTHGHPPAQHVFRSAGDGEPVSPALVDLTSYMTTSAKGKRQPWTIGAMTTSSFMAKFPVVQYLARHAVRLDLVNTDRDGLVTESLAVQEMLDGCGRLLREVRWGVWVWLDDLKDRACPPLSHRSGDSLRKLKFSLHALSSLRTIHLLDFPFHPCQVDVPFLLASTASPALEKVVFEVDFGSRSYQHRELADLLDYNWGGVDEALAHREREMSSAWTRTGKAGSSSSDSPLVSPENSPPSSKRDSKVASRRDSKVGASPMNVAMKDPMNLATKEKAMKSIKFKLYRSPYTDYPVTEPIRAAMPWAERRGLLRFSRKGASSS